MDENVQYAVIAAEMALADSGLDLDAEDRDRIGVVMGTGVGGIWTFENQHTNLVHKGPGRVQSLFHTNDDRGYGARPDLHDTRFERTQLYHGVCLFQRWPTA